MKQLHLLAISFLLASFMPKPSMAADEPITVAWRIKPPYHYSEGGQSRGFLLARARQIFQDAKVPAVFTEEPSKRIWANFAAGKTRYCSIGWYRLPEREAVGQYSHVIQTDLPHTVLVADVARERVSRYRDLDALMADPELTLGVVEGVSYGADLDARIRRAKNKVEYKLVDPSVLARSIGANRISYMFIDREDWDYVRMSDARLRDVKQIDFPDMPAGLSRHIVCSKDVPAATMARLNRAIDVMMAQRAAR